MMDTSSIDDTARIFSDVRHWSTLATVAVEMAVQVARECQREDTSYKYEY